MSPITATAARVRFGELLRDATENDKTFVVEKNGRPAAVLMSIACYEALCKADRGARRGRAIEAARRFREEIERQNVGKTFPTPEEILDAARDERNEQIDTLLR
ncbi:MAG: type II toxin-antitoxin system Phd/YefM family antitoxin [Thermoanaerobaculia bacterium]|nr:type II toxin-antitoxin system Phd/YefM family antitoxin [Thermoanaerobaculia bacterium]